MKLFCKKKYDQQTRVYLNRHSQQIVNYTHIFPSCDTCNDHMKQIILISFSLPPKGTTLFPFTYQQHS